MRAGSISIMPGCSQINQSEGETCEIRVVHLQGLSGKRDKHARNELEQIELVDLMGCSPCWGRDGVKGGADPAAGDFDRVPGAVRTRRQTDAVFWLRVGDIPTVPATGAIFGGEVADFGVAGYESHFSARILAMRL